jgi:hypothetical protein
VALKNPLIQEEKEGKRLTTRLFNRFLYFFKLHVVKAEKNINVVKRDSLLHEDFEYLKRKNDFSRNQ